MQTQPTTPQSDTPDPAPDIERFEDALVSFKDHLDRAVVDFGQQIEQVKARLEQAVDQSVQHGLPTALPEAISELLELQTKLYTIEVEKLINGQVELLSRYSFAHPERVETLPPANIRLYDEGRGLSLFEEALDVTNQLVASLKDETSPTQPTR